MTCNAFPVTSLGFPILAPVLDEVLFVVLKLLKVNVPSFIILGIYDFLRKTV